TSNSNFGIRYTNFNKLPALPNLPKASSANLIDISLIEVDKENHNCSSNELTPINIDKILNQMTQILNMTAPFINGVQQ
ncbi:MAG: hypothetical protein KDD56_04955, partial [Bdellovibrionales bacterium]|nr:hypothetical protein [Bdellovibrionales bacterium]